MAKVTTVKLSQNDITCLAFKIMQKLRDLDMEDAICIYYGHKRLNTYGAKPWNFTIEDAEADDYCSYAPARNIITISSEGSLYDYYTMWGQFPKELNNLISSYGLYVECNEEWNWSLYPIDDHIEVEYPDRVVEKKPEEVLIMSHTYENIPEVLVLIHKYWCAKGHAVGDKGSCVIGEKLKFNYQGVPYYMVPQTGWQGEYSWSVFVQDIILLLKIVGATNIDWYPGHLD